MLRFVNICLVLGLVALAYVIYQVKYQSRALDAEIVTLGKQIDEERDGIAVLRAEWSLLNRPERIERLAQKYLKLAPARPTQLVTIDTVTDRDFDRTRLEAVPRWRRKRRRQSRPGRPSARRPSPTFRRRVRRPLQRPGLRRTSSSRSRPQSSNSAKPCQRPPSQTPPQPVPSEPISREAATASVSPALPLRLPFF